jgi:hypothetical protein
VSVDGVGEFAAGFVSPDFGEIGFGGDDVGRAGRPPGRVVVSSAGAVVGAGFGAAAGAGDHGAEGVVGELPSDAFA